MKLFRIVVNLAVLVIYISLFVIVIKNNLAGQEMDYIVLYFSFASIIALSIITVMEIRKKN